jgi:hypothetical protein
MCKRRNEFFRNSSVCVLPASTNRFSATRDLDELTEGFPNSSL